MCVEMLCIQESREIVQDASPQSKMLMSKQSKRLCCSHPFRPIPIPTPTMKSNSICNMLIPEPSERPTLCKSNPTKPQLRNTLQCQTQDSYPQTIKNYYTAPIQKFCQGLYPEPLSIPRSTFATISKRR